MKEGVEVVVENLKDCSQRDMEATRSSESSVYKHTRHHIPEDGILHSHRSENLKFEWEKMRNKRVEKNP
jgi:hypothetical protein